MRGKISRISTKPHIRLMIHTTVPRERIVMVKGVAVMDSILAGDTDGDIFIFMHQTITTGVRLRGRAFVP